MDYKITIGLKVFAFVMATLLVNACSTLDKMPGGGKQGINLIASSVGISNAGIGAELYPAASLLAVPASQQKVSLFGYSEYGSQTEVLGTNEYSTYSNSPYGCNGCKNHCEACDVECSAPVVDAKTLKVFASHSSVQSRARSAMNAEVEPQELSPVVGVDTLEIAKIEKRGVFVSSSSPDKNSANRSAACYGPMERCNVYPSQGTQLAAMSAPALSPTTMTDFMVPELPLATTDFSVPLLSWGGINHAGFSRRGGSAVDLDPKLTELARAAGNPVDQFPADIKLKSGIGKSAFVSINRESVGEVVYEAVVKTATGSEIPVWRIQFLFGTAVGNQGVKVMVSSADNLVWIKQSTAASANTEVSDAQIAELLLSQFKSSVRGAGANVEFQPADENYQILHYQLRADQDAEFIERIQTSAVDFSQ